MQSLDQAKTQHAEASEKHAEAMKAAAGAHATLRRAKAARAAVLDAIAGGAEGKSTADLRTADDAIRDATHEAELHDGLAEAAKRRKDKAHAAVMVATAADIKARLRAACAEQAEAGRAMDAAVAAAKEAAERFNALSVRISGLAAEGHAHDIGPSSSAAQEGRTRLSSGPPAQPIVVKVHQENRGWPVLPVHSAEHLAKNILGHFGTNLNAA